MSIELYDKTGREISKLTTKNYSTSFSLGIRMLDRDLQEPIYAIYGFVRYADEIVDTFFHTPQQIIFNEFSEETSKAIVRGFSANPILHSFQWVVNKYHIDPSLIASFLRSMELDLEQSDYAREDYQDYIYGSAEVVGLMCLRVFCDNDNALYDELVEPARKLGEAFQKVNFLRDMKSDLHERGRVYFPDLDFTNFNDDKKKEIEAEIQYDFDQALIGIRKLRKDARFGVYLAYIYYLELLRNIRKTSATTLVAARQRVPGWEKFLLLIKAWIYNKLNII
jgi:phytoene/squalene synthetase